MANWKDISRKKMYSCLGFIIATLGQGFLRLLLATCRIKIVGLSDFVKRASQDKTMIMTWHNRLTLVPFILSRYAPMFTYAAVVSQSRDGELLSAVIHSYRIGKTIRVSHQGRHHALREWIHRLRETKDIVVITPDGPRGPAYTIKPGIALAAKETEATVFPLSWSSDRFWELNTWDKLRLPKPFSSIEILFGNPLCCDGSKDIKTIRNELENTLKSY